MDIILVISVDKNQESDIIKVLNFHLKGRKAMKLKKLLLLAFSLVLCLCVTVACSDGGDGGNTSESSSEQTSRDDTSEETSGEVSDGSTDTENEEQTSETSETEESSETVQKQIPVYQGMSITANNTGISSHKFSDKNAGLRYHGDFKGGRGEISHENPFPNNGENENIESEISDEFEVVGAEEEIYYASANDDIYINIHINNPDDFEILSFTLNGKKYSSYMFEEGSDMERIILKYNVGDASGIVEYTIDAIKYVDGTEIKDVIIEGDKTVKAGVKTDDQITVGVSDILIGTNSFGLEVSVEDKDSLIAASDGELWAVLYNGEEIVATKELSLGNNSVKFEGLATSGVYQYAIVGFYDDLSGEGFRANIFLKDAFRTEAVVLFDEITVGKDGISFSLAWHEDFSSSALTALKLFDGDTLAQTIDVSATEVSALLSNYTYKLVAEYANGESTESVYIEFTTEARAVPSVSVSNTDKSHTSLDFAITVTDADGVGAISKVELILGNDATTLSNELTQSIDGLLTDTEYTLKVTYTYDLCDGEGSLDIVKELKARTKARSVPQITLENESVGKYAISADYTITDTDSVMTEYKVELYKADELVEENTEKKIDFDGLDYYTDYKLVITYKYDLGNGVGEQSATYEKTYKTLPYIDVTSVQVLNAEAIFHGDTIYIQAAIENPLSMSVESVVINGKTYTAQAVAAGILLVNFECGEQFDGGSTELKIEKVNATLGGKRFAVAPETNASATVFINGLVEVLGVEVVDGEGNPITWTFPIETAKLVITIDNPTGYTVDSVTLGNSVITDITKVSDSVWSCAVPVATGMNTYKPTLAYSNDNVEKTVESTVSCRIYELASSEVKTVSTAADLKNMNEGYYYELSGDIDIGGSNWQPAELKGVLNGKGYSVKNMTYIGETSNNVGLFSTGEGAIENLTLEKATVLATHTGASSWSNNNFGGFVGYSFNIFFYDCTVDADSVFNLTGFLYVGGVAGQSGNFNNCVNNATITVVGADNITGLSVGGITGRYTSSGHIIDCVNNGDITVSNSSKGANVGGIIGRCNASLIIDGCTNNGDITVSNSGNEYVGGIVGIGTSSPTISGCNNSGEISGKSAGGIIGTAEGSINITDCTNSGEISGEATGGIVGTTASSMNITDCTNSGKVIASKDTLKTTYAGGIVGKVTAQAQITDCTNSGEITSDGEAYTGGIIGFIEKTSVSVRGCVNSGKIGGAESLSGGIVGDIAVTFSNGDEVTVVDCANQGNIIGMTTGGIIGRLGPNGKASVIGCFNSGSLTASGYTAGGVVAAVGASAFVDVTDSLNVGTVLANGTGHGKYVGGILGWLYNYDINPAPIATLNNAYSLTLGSGGQNGASCTVEQLNTKSFYTDTLGWSEDVWDFSELDSANGKYPELK